MKKFISLALLISILLASSCGETGTPNETTTGGDTTKSSSSETTAGRDTPDFEKTDYNGADFTILGFELDFYDKYFFADEQNGERMNDAIYERKMMTEDYLGVKIRHTKAATHRDLAAKVQQNVVAGDDEYQLALPHCIRCVSAMVLTGTLYDWNKLPGVDLSKDYYSHSINDELEVNGKLFYMVSDYMIQNPSCVLFNKGLITDFKLDDPYQLVYDGKWTFDAMYKMADDVTGDLNGDGKMDINDRYGVAAEGNWLLNCIPYACGIKLVERTSDGGFKLALNSEKMVDVVEKFDAALNGRGSMYLWKFSEQPENTIPIDSGRSLFQFYPLYKIYEFRDSAVDYGVLPFPKYDEAQENYTTNDWGSLMCIPASISDPEMVGKVIEYMSYISNDTTIPAYYDVTLSGKLARDEDSSKMMDIIFDNIVFDAGVNYFGFDSNMQRLFYVLSELVIQKDSADFASWYKTYADGAQAAMDDFVANLPE